MRALWPCNASRGNASRRYAFALAAAVSAAIILSPPGAGAEERLNISVIKGTAALRKQGYVELSGDEAVRFLIGNSVLVKKADTPKGYERPAVDVAYYFSGAHTLYDCGTWGCATADWKVQGNKVCFALPSQCDDETYKYYSAPRIFRAPHGRNRTGRIGLYVEYGDILHAIVRGNAARALLIEPNVTADRISVKPADFAEEIKQASGFSGGDKKVPVSGPRAVTMRIGNTFMSDETATDEQGRVHPCPVEGSYYAPDGRRIRFVCQHWPDQWEISLSHWKMRSGEFCLESIIDQGEFGCGRGLETVYLARSEGADTSDTWRVMEEDYPRRISGYVGNVFKFK
jgi:hypothetical protein